DGAGRGALGHRPAVAHPGPRRGPGRARRAPPGPLHRIMTGTAALDAPTIPAVVAGAAARWPDAEALVDGDGRLSFAQLAARADEAARAFVASGVAPGDRVAIWAPNS